MPADRGAPISLSSLAFTVILWFVAGGIVAGALGFRYPANLAPLLIGGTTFALLTWLLASQLLSWLRPQTPEEAAPPTPALDEVPLDASSLPQAVASPAGDPGAAHERPALAWTIGSIALVVVLGFLIGATIAMIGILRVYARERWRTTILTTVGVIVTIYLLFGVALGVPFYGGVFGLVP